MCKTLLRRAKVCRVLYTPGLLRSIFAIAFALSSLGLSAQQLACNDNVQVSLDYNCEAQITPGMILEGEDPNLDPADYLVEIEGVIGDVVTIPGTYTVSVTYLPSGNNCWGTMLVQDKLPPQVDCLCPVGNTDPECDFLCTDLPGILDGSIIVPTPTVDENCSPYTTYMDDVVEDGQECGSQILFRTWIFTDASGNASIPCVQEFRLAPVDLGEVVPPVSPIILPCGSGAEPEDIYAHFWPTVGSQVAYTYAYPTVDGMPVYGAVCNLAVAKTDTEIPACGPDCPESFKVIRNWIVVDWCEGTTRSFGQIIKVIDEEDPTIEVDDLTVGTDPWTCTASFVLPYPNILHDNCSSYVGYDVTGPTGVNITYNPGTGLYSVFNAPKGIHNFVYTAYDCCGNTDEDISVVSVLDLSPPIAIAKQNIVITLTNGSTQGEGQAKMFPVSVDNGSHDGCTDIHLEIRRADNAPHCGNLGINNRNNNRTYNNDGHPQDHNRDTDDGVFVKFCCEDVYGSAGVDEDGDGINDYGIHQVWLRVWDDANMSGVYGDVINGHADNYNEVWADVRVEDKLTPIIVCPPDVTINCNDDPDNLEDTGEAFAFGACGDRPVKYNDTDFTDACGVGRIARRWYIEDYPSAQCLQQIEVVRLNPFDGDIIWPRDVTLDCTANWTGEPTWNVSPDQCALIGYSLKSDTFRFEDGACYKILNHWTVIDWCQWDSDDPYDDGYWTDLQIVKIIDNISPVIVDCDPMMFGVDDHGDADGDGNYCESKAVMLTNSATDNGDCASKWLKWIVDVDLWGDGIIDYTFSSFLHPNNPYYVAPTGSNIPVKVTIPEDIDGSMINHKIQWRVSDGCGNYTSCSTTFMVTDKKSPTPYCVSLSTALMENGEVALWACDFDLGSYDNCTTQENLQFTFTDTHPNSDPNYVPSLKCSSRIFDCDNLDAAIGGVIPVDVYVWDEKDNRDYCTVALTLIDNQGGCGDAMSGRVAGNISTEIGVNLPEVEVKITTDQTLYPLTQLTDDEGNYSFDSNPLYLDYTLTGNKVSDYIDGVSTLDLLAIQKHLLGVKLLDSPYKVIAADVNSDQKVSAIDLLELRKLILGMNDELPSSPSWRFVDVGFSFADITNPWPFSEIMEIAPLTTDAVSENMIGMKIGDVNNSIDVNIVGDAPESRSNSTVSLDISANEEGEVVKMDFYSQDFGNVEGFQFTYELRGLSFVGFGSGAIEVNESNFALLDDRTLTTSWMTLTPTEIEGVMFSLIFKTTASGDVEDMISISSRVTEAEAYLMSGEIADVKLEYRGNEVTSFTLHQNEPNPFSDKTTISFELPERGDATLTIYDVSGRVLYERSDIYNGGYNEITLTQSDIKSSGVMYCHLKSGMKLATIKMIEIE